MRIADGGVTHSQTNITQTERVWFKAEYEYDGLKLGAAEGTVYVNGTAMIWSPANERWEHDCSFQTPGTRTYQVSGVTDNLYGLSTVNDLVGSVSVTWNHFHVFYAGLSYTIPLSTGSAISGFTFDQPNKLISFNVTGESGTTGYCDITIPKELLSADPLTSWVVTLDGNPRPYMSTENATHTFIYIPYVHTSHLVEMAGNKAIPEFPSALILTIFMVNALLVLVLTKKRNRRRPVL